MSPDPHISGYFGLIPAILLYILFTWVTRAQKTKGSKTEQIAFNAFTWLTVHILMLPIHLMIGLLIIGAGVLVSPVVEAVSGFSIKTFIRNYIWVDGSILSFVWTAVIGSLPSMFVPFEEWIKNKRKRTPNQKSTQNKL